MHRKAFVSLLMSVILFTFTTGAFAAPKRDSGGRSGRVAIKGNIILATTTSTYDSGLLDHILPVFTEQTGWTVDVISVGTGAALQIGRDGQADVLLVHARAQEERFVEEGHGLRRFDVMYNDFIVVGPDGILAHNGDVYQTFSTIARNKLPFVSRGDNSGTHTAELEIWKTIGINTAILSEYYSAGQGMGATLQMADEMKAFTLTDRATWLSMQRNLDMVIVCERSEALLNYYGVIAVNPAKHSRINGRGAQDFVNWILLPSTQELIGSYGIKEYGEVLFTPNVQKRR